MAFNHLVGPLSNSALGPAIIFIYSDTIIIRMRQTTVATRLLKDGAHAPKHVESNDAMIYYIGVHLFVE